MYCTELARDAIILGPDNGSSIATRDFLALGAVSCQILSALVRGLATRTSDEVSRLLSLSSL